jgi:hypothetical protein
MSDDPNRVANVRPLAVRLPDSTYDALKAEAESSGRSVSELVREAITLRTTLLALQRAAENDADLRAFLAELRRVG